MRPLSHLLLVVLTLVLKAAALPASSTFVPATQQKWESLTPSMVDIGNTNTTSLDDHNYRINFLRTVDGGYQKAFTVDPTASAVSIIVSWKAQVRRRYPDIEMFFISSDLARKFIVSTVSETYGTWTGPAEVPPPMQFVYLCPPLHRADLSVDLPAAWNKVKQAGWEGSLNYFAVKMDFPQGTPPPDDLYYVFYVLGRPRNAYFRVSTQKVYFLSENQFANNTISAIENPTNGISAGDSAITTS